MCRQGLSFESHQDDIMLQISHYHINLFPIVPMIHVSAVYYYKTLLRSVVYVTFSKHLQQYFLYCFCAKKLSIQISTYHIEPEQLAKEA
jgi:hypothetical protein